MDSGRRWSRELNEEIIDSSRSGLLIMANTIEMADTMLRNSTVLDIRVARSLRNLIKVGREGCGAYRAMILQAMAELEELKREQAPSDE